MIIDHRAQAVFQTRVQVGAIVAGGDAVAGCAGGAQAFLFATCGIFTIITSSCTRAFDGRALTELSTRRQTLAISARGGAELIDGSTRAFILAAIRRFAVVADRCTVAIYGRTLAKLGTPD